MTKKAEKTRARELADEVNAAFAKRGVAVRMGSDDCFRRDVVPTGSLLFDAMMDGGLRTGTVVELYGRPNSGKSFLAYKAMASAQRLWPDRTVAWFDFEGKFSPEFAERCGIDVANLAAERPEYAEEGVDVMEQMLRSGAVSVVVCDSVAAMVPKADYDESAEHSSMATRARLMSKALPKLVAANKHAALLIFINQIREKLGVMWGSPTTTTGGHALGHYAAQQFEVRRASVLKEPVRAWDYKKGEWAEEERAVGHMIGVNVVKDHVTGKEHSTCQIPFKVDMAGIDEAAELVIRGQQTGAIAKKGGGYYEVAGQKLKGRPALWEWVRSQEPETLRAMIEPAESNEEGEGDG